MDIEALDLRRRTRSMGIRIYEDQLEALRQLTVVKHRQRLKIADLIREAIDQFIDREKK
jgi:predicted transcriptional regulator